MLGIEPWSTTFKASTCPAILSLHPLECSLRWRETVPTKRGKMLKCQTLLVTGEWKGQPPSQIVDQETQSPVWLPKLEKGVHEDAGEAPSWCSAELSRVWFGLSCSVMVWSGLVLSRTFQSLVWSSWFGLAWSGIVWSVLI